MKYRFITFVLIFALLLTTGCSAAGAIEKLDTVEDTVENAVRKTVTPAPATALTAEDAEKIALEYVGFTADQVQRMRTGYEIDDGVPQYDVEFHEGDWEYEFEIHAESGKILSFDKDHKYD